MGFLRLLTQKKNREPPVSCFFEQRQTGQTAQKQAILQHSLFFFLAHFLVYSQDVSKTRRQHRVGFRALKKTLEALYTSKVNHHEHTSRGTTRVSDDGAGWHLYDGAPFKDFAFPG